MTKAELISESADLLFHLALLLRARDLSLDAVAAELAARHQAAPADSSATLACSQLEDPMIGYVTARNQ